MSSKVCNVRIDNACTQKKENSSYTFTCNLKSQIQKANPFITQFIRKDNFWIFRGITKIENICLLNHELEGTTYSFHPQTWKSQVIRGNLINPPSHRVCTIVSSVGN